MPADKSYCVCKVGKVKSRVQLRSYFNHHMRLYEVANADSNLRSENEILIGNDTLQNIFSDDMDTAEKKLKRYHSFVDDAKDAVKEVEHDLGRKVRKDAVLELEVVLTFSPGAEVPLDEWKKANCEWLRSYFGEENVKSAVLHMDETTPHIHAMVVPLDRSSGKAHLNSKKWVGGQAAMIKMQNDYAKTMQQFDLQRGEKYSRTSNMNLHEFYENVNKVILTPVPEKKDYQTEEQYYQQIEKVYKSARMQILALELQVQRYKEVNQTMEWNQNRLLQSVEQTLNQAKQREQEYEKKMKKSEEKIRTHQDDLKEREAKLEESIKKSSTIDHIQAALKEIQRTNPEKAEQMKSILNSLIQTGQQISKENEQKAEEHTHGC